MKSRHLLALAAIVGLFSASLYTPPAKAVDCGKVDRVTVAEMTWLSATVQAKLFKRILEDGYGCKVKLIQGSTVPTLTNLLQKGDPMIVPEMFYDSYPDIWEKLQKKNAVYRASNIYTEGAVEGWWIPDYVAEENPGLRTIEDVAEYSDLFVEQATNGKARFYNCPPGWTCEKTNKHLYEALDLANKGFEAEPFSPGSGANLKAAIARKVRRKEPVLAYYWGPTAVIKRYNLVRLDIPAPYDEEKFKCLVSTDCENPQLTAWKPSTIAVGVVPRLKEKAPDVAAFCERVSMPNDVISSVLSWVDRRSDSPEAGARYFLENYQEIWTEWVPADAAERIKAGL